MTMLGIEFLTFSSGVKQITISFDFFELIFLQLLLVQLTALSIDSCITDTSVVLQISNSVLASTYLYNGTFDSGSLTYNKKHFGPDNVPCGTPPLGLPDLEQLLPIITFCLRSRRKAQLSMCDVQFKVVNNIQSYFPWYLIPCIHTVTRSQFIKVCVHYSGYVTQNSYVAEFKKKNQFWWPFCFLSHVT